MKAAALELGLPVTERVDDVLDAGADLGVVVAYGRLIRPNVLDALPMVNLHFSLLPRWRGAAPVERAILAGDGETGVCLMALEEGLDTGPVYACEEVTIGPEETPTSCAAAWSPWARACSSTSSRRGWASRRRRTARPPTPPRSSPPCSSWTGPDRPTSCTAWSASTGGRGPPSGAGASGCSRARPGGEVDGPPGTLDGTVVATGAGGLELVKVQPEGKAAQAAAAWRNGARPAPGERLGT